jgi:hypothetical protein
MFPVLVIMYRKLAEREEMDAAATLGDAYARYAAVTPAFLPRLPWNAGQRSRISADRGIVVNEGRG